MEEDYVSFEVAKLLQKKGFEGRSYKKSKCTRILYFLWKICK